MSLLLVTVRRTLWLLLLATAGGAAYSWWRDRSVVEPDGPAEWPPLHTAPAEPAPVEPAPVEDVAPDPVPVADIPVEAVPAIEVAPWVEPLEGGACPLSHPIKANDNSGIFHVPGGRFYDRTQAERCYSTPDAAAADGYRQAKN